LVHSFGTLISQSSIEWSGILSGLKDAIRYKINETIYRIENAIHVDNNVQSAYDDFCILIQDEMDNKLPRTKQKTYNKNCGKSRYKPYWNDNLQNQWNKVCSLEKMWLKSTGSNSQKETF
jgi:hypothetical protein